MNVLARNAGWVLAGQCASVGLQAAYFVLLTRLLGSSEYGVYIAIVALVSIVNQYSTLGAGFILLRRVSADPSRFSMYWGNVLLTTLLVALRELTTPPEGEGAALRVIVRSKISIANALPAESNDTNGRCRP